MSEMITCGRCGNVYQGSHAYQMVCPTCRQIEAIKESAPRINYNSDNHTTWFDMLGLIVIGLGFLGGLYYILK